MPRIRTVVPGVDPSLLIKDAARLLPEPSRRLFLRGAAGLGAVTLLTGCNLIDSNAAPWFSKVIVAGELLVGLGLLVGALVGIAAFFGALMNMSFLMAGTVSTNPVLFFGGILLILAWKNAGYLGIDRYLLPALGTPWKQTKLTTVTPLAATVTGT